MPRERQAASGGLYKEGHDTMQIHLRKMPWSWKSGESVDPLVEREWLVTNGLGGYASGTIAGVCTRRYHGFLVAALPAPLGRVMMLNHLKEMVCLPGSRIVHIGGDESVSGGLDLHGVDFLQEFCLEDGLPLWRYRIDDHVLEKRVLMLHQQNTVHVNYRIVEGKGPVAMQLRLAVHFRPHDAPVSGPLGEDYVFSAQGDRFELSNGANVPRLHFQVQGPRAAFTVDGQKTAQLLYRIEESRGYDSRGELWSPGYFGFELTGERDATLVVSTEPWETIGALDPAAARNAEHERRRRLMIQAAPPAQVDLGGEMTLAADQFLISPEGRVEDAARARATGDTVCTVIAGYHWFTDWGRDTMISLEGLTLMTGRYYEAGCILRTFAAHVQDGLIPNLFPEGSTHGLYHTADATLWFFHALSRYVALSKDRETLEFLLPTLCDIVDHHLRGTRFGIHVDPADGLLHQGAEGYQLTWMDAKCGDWVVTPRRGKAVEINALWYNALRLLEGWLREMKGDADARPIAQHAQRAEESFNKRFWYPQGGWLYDVVDGEQGDDPSCRPNQIFAISLPHPVLAKARWGAVLNVVRERLLTPVGLRSLAPGEPGYCSHYYGDLRSRDAAYHQGTVWAWLIGSFVDAWLKVHPDDRAGARHFLDGFAHHLGEACLGSVSEIFDAEPPYTARGCCAQAWSVAELLRSWVATAV
jgi:predicted glycogen debranching enzyme